MTPLKQLEKWLYKKSEGKPVLQWFVDGEFLFDYTSPPLKIVELVLTLFLGVVITYWWRLPPEIPISLYLSVLIITLLLVSGINYFQHVIGSEKQDTLNGLIKSVSRNQDDLTKLLATMPPPHAMETFILSYSETLDLKRNLGSYIPEDAEGLEQRLKYLKTGVLMCLHGLARLYVQYEHKPRSTTCYAHWLEYRGMADLDADDGLKQAVRDKIQFVENKDDPLYGLAGVLHVNPEMTVQVGRTQAEPKADENVTEMYLPFPEVRKSDAASTKTRFLPVAPLAFHLGQVDYNNVSQQITKDSLRNEWNISSEVMDEVLEFFGTRGSVGSVVGYKLSLNIEGDTEHLGVLVVFSKSEDSKDGKAAIDAYLNLCRPLIELKKEFISDMVLVRAALSELKAATESEV